MTVTIEIEAVTTRWARGGAACSRRHHAQRDEHHPFRELGDDADEEDDIDLNADSQHRRYQDRIRRDKARFNQNISEDDGRGGGGRGGRGRGGNYNNGYNNNYERRDDGIMGVADMKARVSAYGGAEAGPIWGP